MGQDHTNIHQSLIDECRRGNRSAQGKLYQLYAKAMYNTALRITNHVSDAEDVLQESFINAFKQLKTYQESATFGAWLKRIVINKSIDCVKRRRLDLVPLSEFEMDSDFAQESQEMEVECFWEVRQVQRAMQQLPEGYRIVFSLYMLEGYDHQEIADILGVTISTSKSQLNRSKKKIREILNQMLCHGE